MNALFVVLLALPAFAQMETATPRVRQLIQKARAVDPEDYTGEKGDVSEEEARRPPKKVSDSVWRSSRLDEVGLAPLYELGIRTIVNLEDPGEHRDEQRRLANIERRRAEQGLPAWHIESINVPMSGISRPKFSQLDRALAILADPARGPVLVHCKHGEDRTGVVIAAYRTEIEGKLTLQEAVDEAHSMSCCHLVLIGEHALRNFLIEYRNHRAKGG
jgi:protein tyrosine phosphatase (PTP) superfamily phosphohydrolase (DUF442 family)